jgi:DNA-binding beta-propeller fold protein YncE
VLITNIPPPGSAQNPTSVNFNGVYSITVNSPQSFSYTISNTTASANIDLTNQTPIPMAFFGAPNLLFSGSATTQGIAVNPITRTAALADGNATGLPPQINLLSGLDQSTSSISFFAECTAFVNPNFPCQNAPELLGTTRVAWQPYTNSLISYNPAQRQLSVSDPVRQGRFAIVPAPDQTKSATMQKLLGPGGACITVANASTKMLILQGGVAVDPATNNAFVVESGVVVPGQNSTCPSLPTGAQNNPGQIDIINLDPISAIPNVTNANPKPNPIKPVHVTEIVVPTPANSAPGFIGGISNATVPQAALTCVAKPPAPLSSCDLPGVQIFGAGFSTGAQVLLDGMAIPLNNVQVNTFRKITATIPAESLALPHKFALQVVNGGVASNAVDLYVIGAVDLTPVCAGGKLPQPTGVAVADQIASGPFSPIAIVTNNGCNNIAVVDINPNNATFGTVINNGPVGSNPQGIAISQRFGVAVVANNGDSTVSVMDLTKTPLVPAVPAISTGSNTQPMGVAINEATGATLIANFNANSVSEIDISQIPNVKSGSTLTATSANGIQQPIAVAIDPDRGASSQGIAVVTALQLLAGTTPAGGLAVVDISQATPSVSTTIAPGTAAATPLGIVFDPTAVTGTANNGVFYVSSSGGNQVAVFNPDSGGGTAVSVGFNPTALAYNPQTGGLLTTNFGSTTSSIVDMLGNPLRTRLTLGLPGSAQFGVAIDQFTNMAVIADTANNRLLLFEMPN